MGCCGGPPLLVVVQECFVDCLDCLNDAAVRFLLLFPCVSEDVMDHYRRRHADAWSTHENEGDWDDGLQSDAGEGGPGIEMGHVSTSHTL